MAISNKSLKDLTKKIGDLADEIYEDRRERIDRERFNAEIDALGDKDSVLGESGLEKLSKQNLEMYKNFENVFNTLSARIIESVKTIGHLITGQYDKIDPFFNFNIEQNKQINETMVSHSTYLKGMYDSIKDLPRNMSSFLGWGQLYSLVFDNPIVTTAKNLTSTLSKWSWDVMKSMSGSLSSLVGFNKSDKDDLQREKADDRSFIESQVEEITDLLEEIRDKEFDIGDDKPEAKGGLLSRMLGGLMNLLSAGFKPVSGIFKTITKSPIGTIAGSLGKWVKTALIGLGAFSKNILKFAKDGINKVLPNLTKFLPTFLKGTAGLVAKAVGTFFGFIVDFAIGASKGGIKQGFENMLFGEKGLIGSLLNALKYGMTGAILGGQFGGIWGAVAGGIGGIITGLLTSIAKHVLGEVITDKTSVGEILGMLAGYVTGWFKDVFGKLGQVIGDAAVWIGDKFVEIGDWLYESFVGTIEWMDKAISKAITWLGESFIDIGDWIMDIGKNFVTIMGKVWNNIIDFFRNFPENMMKLWNKAVDGFFQLIKESKIIINKISDFFEELFDKVFLAVMKFLDDFTKGFFSGMKFYEQRKKEIERRRKLEEQAEKLEEKRQKKLEEQAEKQAKITDKLVIKTKERHRLEDDELKRQKQKQSVSLMDQIGEWTNKLGGALQDLLTSGTSTGGSFKFSMDAVKRISEISQGQIDQSSKMINRSFKIMEQQQQKEFSQKAVKQTVQGGDAIAVQPNINQNINNFYTGGSVLEDKFENPFKKNLLGDSIML